MVESKDITLMNGRVVSVPCLQFFEGREKLLLAFMGIDLEKWGADVDWTVNGEVEIIRCGKLTEQKRYPVHILRMILMKEGWDWMAFPDPEMFIVGNKGKIML